MADVLRRDGLSRWITSKERFWVRYLSDAWYRLYLTQLPLVIVRSG